jgi:hypothetical protein
MPDLTLARPVRPIDPAERAFIFLPAVRRLVCPSLMSA